MIITIDEGKAFGKVQHPFIIKKKTLEKVWIKEIYLNIIQATYDKHTANNIVNDEKLKMFTLRSGPR